MATLFTGLHPSSHGLLADRPEGSFLSDALPTLAAGAQQAGVTTVGVSANFLVSRATNLANGFETFVALPEDGELQEQATAADVNATFLTWLRRNRG